MKVSIITVSLDCRDAIERTVRSVLAQDYPDVEFIVIDGGSRDGTQEVLGRYCHRIARLISEPDGGIYSAMNKGLRVAAGEVIAFLNAGDVYAHDWVVSEAVSMICSNGLDATYGDLAYVDPKKGDKVVRYWQAGRYVPGSFSWGWVPPHPTFFCRRTVYERFGRFDEGYRISGDHDLMLRFLERHRIAVGYLPETMVLMQKGGVANTWSGVIRGNWEILSSLRRHARRLSLGYFWRKPLWKLSQVLQARRRYVQGKVGPRVRTRDERSDAGQAPKGGRLEVEAVPWQKPRSGSRPAPVDVDTA